MMPSFKNKLFLVASLNMYSQCRSTLVTLPSSFNLFLYFPAELATVYIRRDRQSTQKSQETIEKNVELQFWMPGSVSLNRDFKMLRVLFISLNFFTKPNLFVLCNSPFLFYCPHWTLRAGLVERTVCVTTDRVCADILSFYSNERPEKSNVVEKYFKKKREKKKKHKEKGGTNECGSASPWETESAGSGGWQFSQAAKGRDHPTSNVRQTPQ